MTNHRFASGAFVFTRTRGLQPRDPDDLPPLAARHGIDPTFIPIYAGDRVAVGRAITQASSGLGKEGFLLRPITRTPSQVVYGIVHERRDEGEQKLDHDFEAAVSWSTEPDSAVVTGDHPIALKVAEAYDTLRGKIVADDWSTVITAYLEGHDAARVRDDGRVYWVPPQRLPEVKKFGAFLAEVGIDLVLCEIDAESRTVVTAVAQESLDEQLSHLETEAEAFDGTQKPSTYTRRLEEYQTLRERAGLYKAALGLGVERAEQVLAALEKKVTAMLEIRSQTVVHRDGSTSVNSVPATDGDKTEALKERFTSLRFAGATFTASASKEADALLFVSDDPGAKSAAQTLEAMGLAGKYQQAGPCKVAIQNSGPPGAAVSIRIMLDEKQPLEGATKALAAIGIELLSDRPVA